MIYSLRTRVRYERELNINNKLLALTLPAMMVMAMQTFVGTWNVFYGPLIYISSVQKM